MFRSTYLMVILLLLYIIAARSKSSQLHDFIVRPLFTDKDFVAEVFTDLEEISDKQICKINNALLKHRVLIFRNQSYLSVESQRSFSQKFGALHSHLDKKSHHPQYQNVNIISNIVNTPQLIGSNEKYHSDLSWSHLPSKITMLRSVITPSYGGETQFADTTAAYEHLSFEWKNKLRNQTGTFTYLKWIKYVTGVSREDHQYMSKGTHHPLITTHPETGRKNIFANVAHVQAVDGVSTQESSAILAFLEAHIESPEFYYAHKWREGDILFWDNRAVQHRASSEPSDERLLIRTTVKGEEPPQFDRKNLLVFVPQQIEAEMAANVNASSTGTSLMLPTELSSL